MAQCDVTNHNGGAGFYLGWNAGAGQILDVKNKANLPIQWFTDDLQRMKLEATQNMGLGSFANMPTDGFLAISPNSSFWSGTYRSPFTRLHLAEGSGNNDQAIGYRPWMRNGITFTGNSDQMYIGQKYTYDDPQDHTSGELTDFSDAIIQWSDNPGTWLSDRMRFIFTSEYNNSNPTGNSSLEGLEAMQLFPDDSGQEVLVGIGDWFAAGVNPSERLDVLDRTIRIQRLVPDYLDDTLSRVVVTDGNGRLHWRPISSLPDNCEWDMNIGAPNHVFTAQGTTSGTCPDATENVGIGTNTPTAKLHVVGNVPAYGNSPTGVLVNLTTDGSGTAQNGVEVNVQPSSGNSVTLGGITANVFNATTLGVGVRGRIYSQNASMSATAVNGVRGEASNSAASSTIGESVGVFGSSTRSDGAVSRNLGMMATASSGTNAFGIEASAYGATYSTTVYGVNAYADGAKASGGTNFGTFSLAYGQNAAPNYGVYGKAEESTSANYGVYGLARKTGTQTGFNYGVYGFAADTTTNNWAGYFSGKVRVTGNAHIANLIIISDQNLKTNIEDLEDAGSIIAQLSPKTYEFIPGVHANLYPPNGPQIGLIAQDVEQILPELVETVTDAAAYDEQGNLVSPELTSKGINYVGLIPVLIGAVKEQQATIAEQNARLDALEQDLAACCESRTMQAPSGGNSTDGNAIGELRASDAADQRLTITPNPFSEGTVIGYTLPKTGMVSLQVSDATGKSLFNLFEGQQMEGTQRYDWNTSFLAPGMYHVTLLVDGAPLVKKAVKVAR